VVWAFAASFVCDDLFRPSLGTRKRVLVISAERNYRKRAIENTLECESIAYLQIGGWEGSELQKLVQNYVTAGLVYCPVNTWHM
jgi:hypothetical protein